MSELFQIARASEDADSEKLDASENGEDSGGEAGSKEAVVGDGPAGDDEEDGE
jgi:hypothetical protein